MKKIWHSRFWWWIPTFFSVVGLLFWFSFTVPAVSGQVGQTAAVTDGQRLSVYRGRLALYRGKTVLTVYDVYVSSLPDPDQALLKDGIGISDEAQLAALLEDYCA